MAGLFEDDGEEDPFERSTLEFTYDAAVDRRRYHEAFEEARAALGWLARGSPDYQRALERMQTAETEWLCADQIIDSPEYERYARAVAMRLDKVRWVAAITREATHSFAEDKHVGVRVELSRLLNYKNVHREGLTLNYGELVAVALPDEPGMVALGRFLAYLDDQRFTHALVLLGPMTARDVMTHSLFTFEGY